MFTKKWIVPALGILFTLFVAAQLVPYGRDHTNPPDGAPVAWDSPGTRALAERACFDCHSNHTRWPWYSALAPVSWRIQNHVSEGREKLNFTAFDPSGKAVGDAAEDAGETVTKGEMPPRDYLLLHPEARLTPAEKAALARGLDATFAAFAEPGERAGAGAPGARREAGGAERGEAGESGEREEGRERGRR